MLRFFMSLIFCFGFIACKKKMIEETSTASEIIPAGTNKINISWTANREADVNAAGGGYRVYYSVSPNVNTATANFVDVPYVSGLSAPTSTQISGVGAATYYIRVVAYSAYNPLSVAGGNRSSDSSEFTVVVN